MIEKVVVLEDLSEIEVLLKVADRVCIEGKRDDKYVVKVYFRDRWENGTPHREVDYEIGEDYIRLRSKSKGRASGSLRLMKEEIEEKLLSREGVYTVDDLVKIFGKKSIRSFGRYVLKAIAEAYPDRCEIVKAPLGKKDTMVWAIQVNPPSDSPHEETKEEPEESREEQEGSQEERPQEIEWKSYGKTEYAVVGRKVLLKSSLGEFEINTDELDLPNPCSVGEFKRRVTEYLGKELGYTELMALIMALTELGWELKESDGFRRLYRGA